MSEETKVEAQVSAPEAEHHEPPAGTPLTVADRAAHGLPPLTMEDVIASAPADAGAVPDGVTKGAGPVPPGLVGLGAGDIAKLDAGAKSTPDPSTIQPEPLNLTDEERSLLPALDHSSKKECPACATSPWRPCSVECYVKAGYKAENYDAVVASCEADHAKRLAEDSEYKAGHDRRVAVLAAISAPMPATARPALTPPVPRAGTTIMGAPVVVQRRCRGCGGVMQFNDETAHPEQAARAGGRLNLDEEHFWCSKRCLPASLPKGAR